MYGGGEEEKQVSKNMLIPDSTAPPSGERALCQAAQFLP